MLEVCVTIQGKGEPTVQQMAAQVEVLRRRGLSILRRVSAVEILCRTMVAMICSYDLRQDFNERFQKGIVAAVMKLASERKYENSQQDLAEWLTNQQLAILMDHCSKILRDIEAIQASANRAAQYLDAGWEKRYTAPQTVSCGVVVEDASSVIKMTDGYSQF